MLAELCSINDSIGAERLLSGRMLAGCVRGIEAPINLLMMCGNYVLEHGLEKATDPVFPKMVLLALTRALATIASRCPDERRTQTMES